MTTVSFTLVVLLGTMHPAQDTAPIIRVGTHPGIWAGHKVSFSIEQVHANGTFDGIGEHLEAPFKGIRFGFHAKFGPGNALVVTRHVAGDTQIARTDAPRLSEGRWFWSGPTSGVGIPDGLVLPFVLSVPEKQ